MRLAKDKVVQAALGVGQVNVIRMRWKVKASSACLHYLLHEVPHSHSLPLLLLRDEQVHQTTRQMGADTGWVCRRLLHQNL